MKKSKHTRGPWKSVRTTGGELLIKSKGRRVVADVRPFTTSEDEANARLLAAAPEMLEALTACMFALGRAGANVQGGPGRPEWERARAAIKKATFESVKESKA